MVDTRDPEEDPALDDAQFREGVRARDSRAWDRLVALLSPVLRRQASSLLPSRMDAEDVVAHVWFLAVLNVRRYDAACSPLPWLARICTNVCMNSRRGPRARPTEPLHDNLRAPPASPAEDADARRNACYDALAELPEREREVVTLRHLFALSTKEIARLLGVAGTAVDQALYRGMERLKNGPAAVTLAEWREIGCLEGMERVRP